MLTPVIWTAAGLALTWAIVLAIAGRHAAANRRRTATAAAIAHPPQGGRGGLQTRLLGSVAGEQPRAKKSQGRDERQQLYFIGLFLLSSVAGTVSNSLESGYIAHITPCEDSRNISCSPACPAPYGARRNISCLELVNVTGCDAALPAWAHPAKGAAVDEGGRVFLPVPVAAIP